jgi:hypothetical protein
MKKILLTLFVMGGFALNSFAQTNETATVGNFSVGFEAGLPVGDVSNTTSAIIGGSLKYDYPLDANMFLTFSGGLNYFSYKSSTKTALAAIGVYKSGESFVPLKVGVKYFFDGAFYGEAQLGAAISTEENVGTAFAYAPGIGYKIGGGIDLGIRYEGWSRGGGTVSQVGARLAYTF